jgi:hypothetical protein
MHIEVDEQRGTCVPGIMNRPRPVGGAPPSFAKSLYGEPPTASIPKTRDQPEEEANSIQPPPYGNSDSTGISPVPPIYPATRRLTNDKQHTPH